MSPLVELVVMSIACGIFLARSVDVIKGVVERRLRRKIYPSIEKMPKSKACKYHSWANMFLVVNGLEPKKYDVCHECGSVAGTNKRLNKAGLDIYHERQKIYALQNQIFDKAMRARQIKLDLAMNRLIKSFIQCNPNIPLQENVEFMKNFFHKAVLEIDTVNREIEEVMNDHDTNKSEPSQ